MATIAPFRPERFASAAEHYISARPDGRFPEIMESTALLARRAAAP